jgi:prepilin-type processing-associated H-X9-DG protein
VLQRDHLEPRFPEVAITPSPFFSGYIIAILAAILFPVFARAREKARQASCQSNLKQIMLSVIMYQQDYDSRYPIVTTGPDAGNLGPQIPGNTCGVMGWCDNKTQTLPLSAPGMVRAGWVHKRLEPYVKNVQIWTCPSMTPNADPNTQNFTSYLSTLCTVSAWPTWCLQGDAEQELRHSPAETPLYLDAVRWYEPGGAANMPRSTLQADKYGSPHTRDGAGPMNVGYADGHVKSMPVMTAVKDIVAKMPLN